MITTYNANNYAQQVFFDKAFAYLIYGVEDGTRKIIGTDFHALSKK